MKATRYIPSFVDHRESRPTVEFETTEELLAIEWVASWGTKGDFSHFAKSEHYLMAILNDGKAWWVVASLSHPDDIDLPEWEYIPQSQHKDE